MGAFLSGEIMTELFKRYPKTDTRQIIDYNRFQDLTGEKIFICVDRGILEIMRYLLNSRGTWQTTYATEYQQYGYLVPTLEQMDELNEIIAEANIDMSNCDDLVTAIQGIGPAIAASLNSSGSGGCCVVNGNDDISTVSGQPPFTAPGGGDFPPNFEDETTYQDFVCKAIQYFVYRYCGTLRNWGGLFGTLGGITMAVITGLTLLVVPPLGLMIILAALSTIAAIDIGLLTTLSSLADCIEDQVQDIVCSFKQYQSDSGDSGYIREHFYEDYIIDCVGGVEGWIGSTSPLEDIMLNLVSTEALSAIFTPNDAQKAIVDAWESPYDVDCECGETGTYTFDHGTETSEHPANPITGTAEDNASECANGEFFAIKFHVPVTVTEITVNGAPSSLGGCGECAGQDVFWYFSNEAATTLIQSGSARPQDDAPVSGVRYLLVELDCDGTTPTISVTYTLD
jgi:hypothetical protein